MTEQEKITLEHIAPYLPYGLKYATLSYDDGKYYIKPNYNTIGVDGNQSNVTNICLTEYSRPTYKICLRPLSDLTKPITVDGYNDGKEFVPIVELAKLTDSNILWDLSSVKSHVNEYSKGICSEVKGTSSVLELNDTEMEFHYDSGWLRFALRNNSRERPQSFSNQLKMFQMLYKWHFDIHGLIGQGLAIDINTLKNNTL